MTDTYVNRIGLKGYHFVITDEPCHEQLSKSEVKRIFGENILKEELKHLDNEFPTVEDMVQELKRKTHQFVLILNDYNYHDTVSRWKDLCGEKSVIMIDSTRQLPEVISAIIGLTEGTLDIGDLMIILAVTTLIWSVSFLRLILTRRHDYVMRCHILSLRRVTFCQKGDLWPILARPDTETAVEVEESAKDEVRYL